MEIKIQLNSIIEFEAFPNMEHWKEATPESRDLYLKEQTKDYIIDNIEDIINDLINEVKISII